MSKFIFPLINSNPTIISLNSKITKDLKKCSPIVANYITSIIQISKIDIVKKYIPNGITEPIHLYNLPEGFNKIIDLKEVPGIYFFIDKEDKGYVGSSRDLFKRLNRHRLNALSKPNLHTLFYSAITEKSWSDFRLEIYSFVNNHLKEILNLEPNYSLTSIDIDLLNKLTAYELTILEQAYMQLLDTSYNIQIYSNWGGGKNKGASGSVRSDIFKNNLSETFIGRNYENHTISLHRKNMLGKKFSEDIRLKMSESHGGVVIHYYSNTNQKFGTFSNKSLAAKNLGISIRTVTRWAESRTPKFTKIAEYGKITLGYSPINITEVE
jgi:group I intron endonuclease